MTAYVPAVFLLNVVTSQCVRMKMSPSRAFLISLISVMEVKCVKLLWHINEKCAKFIQPRKLL